MKKYIKSVTCVESIDLGRHFGSSWRVMVYDTGELYVKSTHPYDLQEYHWARSYDGGKTFQICRNQHHGPVLIKTFQADEDQEYMDVVAELAQLDRDIDPRIDHT